MGKEGKLAICIQTAPCLPRVYLIFELLVNCASTSYQMPGKGYRTITVKDEVF